MIEENRQLPNSIPLPDLSKIADFVPRGESGCAADPLVTHAVS
ncbi:hypothetical protein AB7M47_007171 [Bradyrhizobium elkanii]